MASIQKRGSRYQLRISRKILPRPFFFSFDTYEEAATYGSQLEALLDRGIVPAELMERPELREDPLLHQIVCDYEVGFPITRSDASLLGVVLGEIIGVRYSHVTFQWVEGYVAMLKEKRKLTPGTIRKRIGLLGRVMDWHLRRINQSERPNPFRLLPEGYSNYSGEDIAAAGVHRVDVERDRRLSAQEGERIAQVLAGEKRPDRERAWGNDPDFRMLYHLIVDTGLRLFEAYRLRVGDVDLVRNIVRVEGSKGARGASKPRFVPIVPRLRPLLKEYIGDRANGLMFPFWDGREDSRRLATGRLSARFRTLFAYAELEDITEHDLRHESACRWFELRHADGRWVFSEIEVCRIMGWKDPRMALRYASLRGEDLSSRLD